MRKRKNGASPWSFAAARSTSSQTGFLTEIPLIDMHRDICGITHGSLDILLGAYKDAVEQGLCKRYKTKQLRELVRTALSEGIVDIEGANEGLVEDIRELQVS